MRGYTSGKNSEEVQVGTSHDTIHNIRITQWLIVRKRNILASYIRSTSFSLKLTNYLKVSASGISNTYDIICWLLCRVALLWKDLQCFHKLSIKISDAQYILYRISVLFTRGFAYCSVNISRITVITKTVTLWYIYSHLSKGAWTNLSCLYIEKLIAEIEVRLIRECRLLYFWHSRLGLLSPSLFDMSNASNARN